MGKMDEIILAIPRTELFGEQDESVFQGFLREDFSYLDGLSLIENRRGDLEEDKNFKQLITYTIVRAENENKFLAYERIGNGDVRLQNNESIGVGGHANYVDEAADIKQVLIKNALRELKEEIKVPPVNLDLQCLGYINDDSNDVGQVHIGVVFLLSIPSIKGIEVNETDTLKLGWKTVKELQHSEALENWSKILVPYLMDIYS